MRLCVFLLLFALYSIPFSSGALFAVDLGSEFIKVSLIKPGRVPISIVNNALSKRKTPSAVAFHPTTRIYGEDALTFLTRMPDRVFLRTRDYLGRTTSDPFLQSLYGDIQDWTMPYELIPDSSPIRFKLGKEESLSVLEILGSLFAYVKMMTRDQAVEEVLDCVIAVPAFFGPVQKRAILDAAKLAEINVLTIINAHGAAALQYGIERDFSEIPQNVIIYDMGANSIQTSLISYTAYDSSQMGRKTKIGQFEVKDVTWNANLGGEHLDWKLVHYFAKRFNEKFKVNVYESNRSIMKLKKAASKTKQILSANTDANFHVEELFDGIDFNDKIARAEFEMLNSEFFEQAIQPLKTLLERNEIKVSNLTAVELIGGGTRVPRLQAVISEALSGRQLDKHLDGDEAIVMGGGLVAANLSTIFRLRKFGYVDGIVYPMLVQVKKPKGWKPLADVDVTSLFLPKSLLPYMKRLPCKRVVNLANFSNVESFDFEIKFDTTSGHPLPPGASSEVYATYTVSNMKEAVKKHGEGGKISIHFFAHLSGLVEVDRAEYVVEVNETIPVVEKVKKNDTNTTAASENETDTMKASKNDTDTAKASKNETDPVKTRKIFKKAVLTVSKDVFVQASLTPEEVKASRIVLKKYSEGEAKKRASEEAKNLLESFVVEVKEKMNDQFEIKEVTTEAERTAYIAQLNEVEEWLYMDGADADHSAFNAKLVELRAVAKPIFTRATESVQRPVALEQAKGTLGVIEKALNSWTHTKPWIVDDLNELADHTKNFQDWIEAKMKIQEDLEPHETPAFTSLEIFKKLTKLEKLMTKIGKKKNPKPPPAPNANNTANDTTNSTAEESAEKGSEKKEKSDEIFIEDLETDHIEL